MQFEIPRPLKAEYEALHNMLRKATQEPGELGEAAKAVAKLMHPHFIKEEYALPPPPLYFTLRPRKRCPTLPQY
jgi:hypothetical protein